MRIFLIALVLYLSGCAGRHLEPKDIIPGFAEPAEPTVTLHMDTAFTAAERADADHAARVWESQTDGLARIVLVYDLDFDNVSYIGELVGKNASLVVRFESDMAAVAAADDASDCDGCVLGWMTSGGIHNPAHKGVMGGFVADRITKPGMRINVMLHEFGHAIGLPHVGARQAIMYPSADPRLSHCLKKPDLDAFCSVNECGTHKMHPCE